MNEYILQLINDDLEMLKTRLSFWTGFNKESDYKYRKITQLKAKIKKTESYQLKFLKSIKTHRNNEK